MIPHERRDAAVSCWLTPSALGSMPHGKSDAETNSLWPASNCPQANEVFYISGILTSGGDIKENRKVFERAQRMLLSKGCSVFNPIHIEWPIDPLKDDALFSYFMHFCVRAIPECDGMLMLPNWQNSKGAKWEHRIAEMLGLRICYSPVLEESDERQ
jgi:hypothetical protein